MTEQELKKHLDEAETGPKKLAAAVSGLSDRVLRYKPSPGKWCILEIVGHLADVEIVYAYRMRQMIADKKPVIAPIDQDDWARNLGYMQAAPAELVAQYGLNRHHNLRVLRRLKPEDLTRSAYHPERRTNVDLEDMVQRLASHDANHLAQIERLKKEAGQT
jgi:hypothetical protein